MSLPAARIALSHVDPSGEPRSHRHARADEEVGGLLWRGQPEHRPLGHVVLPRLQRPSFEAYVRRLLRHRRSGKRMVLVLDNAAYHHARVLKPLLRKHRRHLSLFFLPPYSRSCPPSSESGNSPGVWQRTTGTSQRSRLSWRLSRPASVVSSGQTLRSAVYAASLKTLCLELNRLFVRMPSARGREIGSALGPDEQINDRTMNGGDVPNVVERGRMTAPHS